jgi:hypothetical protein
MARPSRVRADDPQHEPACGEGQCFSEDLEPHLSLPSTERHAQPDLRCSLRDRVGHDSIDAKRGQQQRERRQATVERDIQSIGRAKRSPTI